MTLDSVGPEQFAATVAARTDGGHDPASSLCRACTDMLGVTGAGLILVSGGRSLGCIGVSDHVSETVEQLEYTLGEGPCLSAYATREPVFAPDLADEASLRWPEFRRGALAAGIRAAFGFPLLVGWICIGALNLYHDESGDLTAAQIDNARTVARLTSKKLLAWQAQAEPGRMAWQMEHVPNHWMEVHQATGRISVQADLEVDDALALLRAYAFAHDRPIRDIAAEIGSGALRFD